jgi:hypothetical protein
MTRFILVLSFLIAAPALAEVDVLDSPALNDEYPYVVKRLEKRTSDGALICGLVVRCKLPDERDCRMQYKSEVATDSIYVTAFDDGTSSVSRKGNGSLLVTGAFSNDKRAAQPGFSAPAIEYTWGLKADVKYDKAKKTFTFKQQQGTLVHRATFNNEVQDVKKFVLKSVTHCTEMTQLPDQP